MNIDGLWLVDFIAGSLSGTGVVVFSNGILMGGDSTHYYAGRYQLAGNRLTAEMDVHHFAGPLNSVFGPRRFVQLKLDGATTDDLIMAQGFDRTMPQVPASFRLRRAEIPRKEQ